MTILHEKIAWNWMGEEWEAQHWPHLNVGIRLLEKSDGEFQAALAGMVKADKANELLAGLARASQYFDALSEACGMALDRSFAALCRHQAR